MADCLICERIAGIKAGTNRHIVAELETGYVVIGDDQLFPGYTLFLCKLHAEELHDLDAAFRARFLEDMSQVAAAVWRAFKPQKLNYEMLGNTDRHMHWHIIPRFDHDAAGRKPIWTVPKPEREANTPTSAELEALKASLKKELVPAL